MPFEFEASMRTLIEANREMARLLNNPGGFVQEAQRRRLQKDHGLAALYERVSPVVNSTTFDIGAAKTYITMRIELDRTNPEFTVDWWDTAELTNQLVGQLQASTLKAKERTPTERKEWSTEVTGMSLRQMGDLGPRLRGFLAVHEEAITTLGYHPGHKVLYMLGSVCMSYPILRKLNSQEVAKF